MLKIDLYAVGNHYYEFKSGIGFHGDAERKIVLCVSLGRSTTLRYCWRAPGSNDQFGEQIDLTVEGGNIYIMSEKATGFDFRNKNIYRLVHAAGHEKYFNT